MDRNQIILLAAAVGLFFLSLQLGGRRTTPPVPPERTVEAPGPSASTPATAGEADKVAPRPPADSNARVTAVEDDAVHEATLANGQLRVVASNEGARIRSAQLLDYKDRVGGNPEVVELASDTDRGLLSVGFGAGLPETERTRYRITQASERAVEFLLDWSNGAQVVQRLELDEQGYGGQLSVTVRNGGAAPLDSEFEVFLYGRDPPQTGVRQALPNHRLTVDQKESSSLIHQPLHDLERPGMFSGATPLQRSVPADVEWVGIESQYFLTAVLASPGHGAQMRSAGLGVGSVELSYAPKRGLDPGQEIARQYRLYLGPKVEETVQAVDARLEPALIVGYAWVRPITLLFAYFLNWIYNHVIANYGAGIIAITVLLRLAMFPLTQKSLSSMRKMSVIAPQLKEIQERYRDDAQRQQQELMALYKRTGINPITALGSGCLPMLIQMPFMVALYFALQGMIELRQAPFVLWINDLSAPENFFTLAGVAVRPLALLMGGSMFLQTYLQPGSSDPQQQQQRQMMLMMSLVFVVMFYSFPSGLVLYWLVSNLLGIGQQVLVNRMGLGPTPSPSKA